MAGVNLLRMSDNPARKITQRTARQLEDGERVQCVVIIVVIIERESLILAQDLVKAELKLVRTIRGFHHVLSLGAGAPRTRQELHQTGRNGVEALGGHHAAREYIAIKLGSARSCCVQCGLAGRSETWSASRPVFKDVSNSRIVQRARKRAGSKVAREVARGRHWYLLRNDTSHDATAFVGAKKEGLVPLNGAAQRSAKLVLLEGRLRRGLKRESVGVEDVIAQKLVDAAV